MRLHRLLSILLCALLCRPTLATWSVICLDTSTGEIAIGSATCLSNFDLKAGASVVLVDFGAAAAQSRVDSSGSNRRLIFNQMMLGTSPDEILAMLASTDPSHRFRQYGIVDRDGRSVTFTGTGASDWAGGLTGSIGTIVYAIQGNLLTGEPVVTAAEAALLSTPGGVPERLMAAMEAAMFEGGDARCSGFGKSAHIGYMIVSREGDTDGGCIAGPGCATGDYYMEFNVAFQNVSNPDPVVQMREQFDTWRASLRGRTDAVVSDVTLSPVVLSPDGLSTASLEFTLRDWDGEQVDPTSLVVTVTHDDEGDGVTTIGDIAHLGDGVYSVVITSGTEEGVDHLRITVDDGVRPVTLMPSPTITSRRLLFDEPNGLPPFIDRDGGTSFTVVASPDRNNAPMPGTGVLHVDAGTGFVALPMHEGPDNTYQATFPATPCGADVRYYVSVETTTGAVATHPLGGARSPRVVRNSTGSVIGFHDDFETDTGWTTENLGATSGDWERGVPVNDPGWAHDPPSDADGSGQCYLTANAPGNTDVDLGAVRLVSPTLDFSSGFLSFEYDYYLRLFPSEVPDMMLVEISSDGDAGPWIEIARHDLNGNLDWRHVMITSPFMQSRGVALSDTMKLRFTVNDDDPQSNVEAGLDGFLVNVSDCQRCQADVNADERLNTSDLLAFLGLLSAGNPVSDLAQPYGVFDGADLTAYLKKYFGGC